MPVKHNKQTAIADNALYDVSKDEWNEPHTVDSGEATVVSGETYVDKAHGLSLTPDINKIKLTPKDDLGGRSYWISDVGGTTFRVNIGSMDMVDHVFGYVIL